MTRQFESAMAALICSDPNPMRLFLGLEPKGDCEDCGCLEKLVPHGKNLVCEVCKENREKFLADEAG